MRLLHTVHATIAERFFAAPGDRVWAGITHELITVLNAVDAARSVYDRSAIILNYGMDCSVARSVVSD